MKPSILGWYNPNKYLWTNIRMWSNIATNKFKRYFSNRYRRITEPSFNSRLDMLITQNFWISFNNNTNLLSWKKAKMKPNTSNFLQKVSDNIIWVCNAFRHWKVGYAILTALNALARITGEFSLKLAWNQVHSTYYQEYYVLTIKMQQKINWPEAFEGFYQILWRKNCFDPWLKLSF